MPRSFLVKKQQGSKKPNYGRLKAETDEAPRSTHEDPLLHRHHPSPGPQQRAPSLSCPLSLRASPPNTAPPSLLDRSPGEAPRPAAPCPQVNLDIQRVPGNYRRTDSAFPPSLPLLALFPAVPPGDGSQDGFECADCRKECLSLPGLAEHKQLRCEWSSKKFFSCKFCEKEYVSLGALKMHIRTHTLPCVCKLCGKAFSRPWLLQGHIRTHTGEKPFSCLHCSRAFADRSNLRAHLQTHSEVKKYRCASCFKTFSRISLLAKHQEAGCPLS